MMTRADVYCPPLCLPTELGLLNKLDLSLKSYLWEPCYPHSTDDMTET